ncbi:MAG TPA: amidohydrolase [Bacteroidaceae bacterium]|nr:amidohydrolase [Bacteroidaceae bacterium]
MKIALLQLDIQWGKSEYNRKHIADLLNAHLGVDIYVLPEMFTTGFCANPNSFAEPVECSETLSWMKEQAKKLHAAIAGSVLVSEENTFRNRFFFVYPDGYVKYYDKRHLFTYGGEHKYFTPGKQRVIVEYKGWRILLQICYDLRFPVFSRNIPESYDLALYVASWPSSRIAVWDALLVARAIENQSYVAYVNRVGEDPQANYEGSSGVVDPYGHKHSEVLRNQEGIMIFTLDKKKLESFRKKFPVLQDGDVDLLNY